ncbi:hypothetical protein [Dysgonomonas sp. ZJ709]|uniref:hypothetical protein n=1 Tax=Dysgonomonas sp. ZJ709 TaxID=2709797 RepID=UPI0013EB736D|nr:hypothetical protein [Dysgonomonas sp. ZJ709]
MGKTGYSIKKQHGDASRLAPLINQIRIENGKDPYSLRMINAIIDGKRSMPDYARDVIERYYSVQEELSKCVLV